LRLDLEDFRQHYASLSDNALLALDRDELVEEAQKCFDEELARRKLDIQTVGPEDPEISAMPPTARSDQKEASSSIDGGQKPGWLDSAACACGFSNRPGDGGAAEIENARSVLESSGIPYYVVVHELEPLSVSSPPVYEYELMVPGGYSMLAQSLLDKEIFNPQMEATWRTQFELLSDEELQTMSPQTITEGLLGRIERLTRIYTEEISRRKLALGYPASIETASPLSTRASPQRSSLRSRRSGSACPEPRAMWPRWPRKIPEPAMRPDRMCLATSP
jgi:hypothetical protein